ncbi:MAG: tRNA lysidine(34) synthetase TilS, partial [bacterium]
LSRATVRPGAISDLARRRGIGIEAAAREFRYRILAREASMLRCEAVLTAHQEDDLLETLIFRMLRGSGVNGLKGIPESRSLCPGVTLLRPFLSIPRSLIEAYAAEQGMVFSDDSTNGEDGFARNRLRHRLLPVLDSGYPGWRAGLSATRSALESDAQALGEAMDTFISMSAGDSPSVSYAAFDEASPALRQGILARLLYSSGSKSTCSRRSLGSIAGSLARGLVELRFRDRTFKVASGRLECLPALDLKPEHGYFFMVSSAGTFHAGGLEVSAIWSTAAGDSALDPGMASPRGFLVEGSFDFPLVVRTRMPGDRIRNETGSAMVDDLLKSWKVTLGRRQTVPVVEDKRGVVAVLPGSMEVPPAARDLHRYYNGPMSGRRLFIRVKGA